MCTWNGLTAGAAAIKDVNLSHGFMEIHVVLINQNQNLIELYIAEKNVPTFASDVWLRCRCDMYSLV